MTLSIIAAGLVAAFALGLSAGLAMK